MTIQLPQELEDALHAKANLRGLSASAYLQELLERELAHSVVNPRMEAMAALYGSGKHIWGDEDAVAYVDRLRDGWL